MQAKEPEDASTGRFSYDGDGDGDAVSIRRVELRFEEYGGPFWDSEGCIGDDWSLWERAGLKRETYDACMRWTGDQVEKSRLLGLMRAELPDYIDVESSAL